MRMRYRQADVLDGTARGKAQERMQEQPGKDERNLKCCNTEMKAGKCSLVELAKEHHLVLSELQLEITTQGYLLGEYNHIFNIIKG